MQKKKKKKNKRGLSAKVIKPDFGLIKWSKWCFNLLKKKLQELLFWKGKKKENI
jgi:hypothetical protein